MLFKWIMKVMGGLHIFVFRRSSGAIMGKMRGMDILLLTTRGRKTGKQRTTSLMYFTDGPNYVVTASNGGQDRHPAWWLNLQNDPQAIVEVGGRRLPMMAREADEEERSRLWAQLVSQADFFADYEQKTSRKIPVVLLQLEGQGTNGGGNAF